MLLSVIAATNVGLQDSHIHILVRSRRNYGLPLIIGPERAGNEVPGEMVTIQRRGPPPMHVNALWAPGVTGGGRTLDVRSLAGEGSQMEVIRSSEGRTGITRSIKRDRSVGRLPVLDHS